MMAWRRFAADRRGAVSLLTAFALPALVGMLALGTEVAYWLVRNRTLQNAADSAATAAAMDTSGGYLAQAKAMTARYGLIDGSDGVTVSASDTSPCPAGGSDCTSVTVAASVPVYLGFVLDYFGNTTSGGAAATRISAMAVARPGGAGRGLCLVGLAIDGTDPAIASSGAPKAALTGCGVASNTGMRCTGGDLGADFGDAVGVNNGCGAARVSGAKPYVDPYAALAAKLPADGCGGAYPQSGALPPTNKWSGTRGLGAATTVCGDLQLTGDVTVVAPADAILVLRNGSLLTNGFRFQTASGSALAVIFTGVSSAAYDHVPQGAGELDIAAPTSGVWSGIAIYQDPALTMGVQLTGAASDPAWAISGLVYLPHADLVFKGAVGKSSNGRRCTAIVANSVTVKGTGLVLSTAECGAAGLIAPGTGASGRAALVG